MKIIKHCYIIGFIFLLNLSTVLYARQVYQKGEFSISLPDGWVEIPSDVIDAYEKEIARLAPNAPTQHYDYGFQLGSADNWFEYPYILIQINNMGRIPESHIEKLEGYSVTESVESDLSTVLSDVQIGKMHYDKTSRIIWLRIEANVVGVGPISGLSGMILTEKGFIQVNGYALKSDYSTYEPVFRAIVMSVTPSSELVYKPKWSDSLPPVVSSIDWSKVAGNAIAGAIIAGLIALLNALRRKKE